MWNLKVKDIQLKEATIIPHEAYHQQNINEESKIETTPVHPITIPSVIKNPLSAPNTEKIRKIEMLKSELEDLSSLKGSVPTTNAIYSKIYVPLENKQDYDKNLIKDQTMSIPFVPVALKNRDIEHTISNQQTPSQGNMLSNIFPLYNNILTGKCIKSAINHVFSH